MHQCVELFTGGDYCPKKAKHLSYSIVQLFEHIIDTDRDGRFGRRSPGHVHAKTDGLGYGRPGGAWAARREAIAGGLYDRHAIGGGDSAMLCAWEGREDPQISNCCSDWNRNFQEWAFQSRSQVGSSLACVPGDAVHLYHGTRANRRYVERYRIFHDHAYDPVRDVDVDPTSGFLQWSEFALQRKPDLVGRVAEYFEQRREDE